jgi:hypothetical protein
MIMLAIRSSFLFIVSPSVEQSCVEDCFTLLIEDFRWRLENDAERKRRAAEARAQSYAERN